MDASYQTSSNDPWLNVLVEVSRGGRVKRRPDGRLHYVSPFASPFNYGCAPDAPVAQDGDPQDVLLLGPAQPTGFRCRARRVGTVFVVDDGLQDDKWVAVPMGVNLTTADIQRVDRFFKRYQQWKNRLAWCLGTSGVCVRGHDLQAE